METPQFKKALGNVSDPTPRDASGNRIVVASPNFSATPNLQYANSMGRSTRTPATRGHSVAHNHLAQLAGVTRGSSAGEITALSADTPAEPPVEQRVGGVPMVRHRGEIDRSAPRYRSGSSPDARTEATYGVKGRPALFEVQAQDRMISTPRGMTGQAQPGDKGDFAGRLDSEIADFDLADRVLKNIGAIAQTSPVTRARKVNEIDSDAGMSGRMSARGRRDLAEKRFKVESDDGGEYVTRYKRGYFK